MLFSCLKKFKLKKKKGTERSDWKLVYSNGGGWWLFYLEHFDSETSIMTF